MLNSGIIKKAINESKKSNLPIFKVGAVVFKGNRILGYGHNRKGFCGKINPKYRNPYDSIHAEQSAIFSVKNWSKLKGTSILVIRLTRSNMLSMARPCDICFDIIKHVGIKEIYYSNHEGEIIRNIIWNIK